MRNFLYLNATALDGYLSALEDGLRVDVERESKRSSDRALEGDAKVVKGKIGSGRGETDKTRGVDTPEARFARLLNLAAERPDGLAWVDVVNPDVDLQGVGFGAMIAGEAEFYVPTMIRTFADTQGMTSALDLVDQLEPLAGLFNLNTEGMPNRTQRQGFRSALGAMKAELVAVGEFDSSDWKIAGQLPGDNLRAEVDGPAQFVGKVSRQWGVGEGRHLLALPGSTLLPQEKRREMERKRPENPDDDSFLTGPALMLDLLAIWR